MPNDLTYTITPEMVYGKDYKIPDGWELVSFRAPLRDEKFLHGPNQIITCHLDHWPRTDPRLVLRKKHPRRIVLEECGYEDAYRWDNDNNWRLHVNPNGHLQYGSASTGEERLWFRIVEG